jgi:PAS domain S-box-containing protein
MAIPIPQVGCRTQAADEPTGRWGEIQFQLTLPEALNTLLEFTGATAGWIGLVRADGRLYFPARAGTFSDAWLTLQLGQTSIWGFAVGEGPAIVNDLPRIAILGDPPLRNLLICLLPRGTKPAGQLVLANKPNGFNSQDAAGPQMMAHLLSRQLVGEETSGPSFSMTLLRQVLDHLPEGVLIVDQKGSLLFANTTWGQWTGYASEELCGRRPPFPFWVSQAELTALAEIKRSSEAVVSSQGTETGRSTAAGWQQYLLPFRHQDRSLFWCQMETTAMEICGQAVRIAFLRQIPTLAGAARSAQASSTPQLGPPLPRARAPDSCCSRTGAETLPLSHPAYGTVSFRRTEELVLLMRSEGFIELWDKGWEELTGLTCEDLAGVSTELFLDWLFPHQCHRSFVADLFHQTERGGVQALLEVAGRTGNCPLVCTFLPVRTASLRSSVNDAWLILARAPDGTTTKKSRRRRRFRKSSLLRRTRFCH